MASTGIGNSEAPNWRLQATYVTRARYGQQCHFRLSSSRIGPARGPWLYNEIMLIEGILAAVPTPFYADERVYFRKLEANVARYSRSLLSGLLLLGSTGEAVALDDTESRETLRVAAEAAAPEKVLIAGVGRESVKGTVELAEAAAQFHYDAVLVRTPTYYASQMSPAAVLHYFRSVADRSPLPVLLYNIPRCVPYSIPMDLIGELAQHPNIIGIKDSSGDLPRITATVEATRRAPRRTVTVTPIFEAVTARMLLCLRRRSGRRGCRGHCSAGRPHQDTDQGGGFPGAYRFGRYPSGRASGRSFRSNSGIRRLCAASLPGGLPGLEGSRSEAGRREAGARCCTGAAYCGPARHLRPQACLRLQRLLRWARQIAASGGYSAGKSGDREAVGGDSELKAYLARI